MRIEIKPIEHYPLHLLSRLEINGKHFCYVLEDILRPFGVKVNSWTAIPRGTYNLGIRFSPKFNRECISISNQADGVTIIQDGVEFKFCMFHGGNDALDSDGCPLIAFNMVNRTVKLDYNGKKTTFTERAIQGTAEKALFDLIAPKIKAGEQIQATFL